MPEFLQQLRTFYDGLEPSRRRTLLAAVALSVLLVAGVGVWASQPAYVALTTPPDADMRSEITESLSRASIGWRLGADGATIEVLAADETRARAAAAGDHGILGLEGLEQLDPWATPFVETLQKQRMLQGELVRAINRLDGVARSACILNLPSGSAFLQRESRPSAAVTLSPDPGTVIDSRTARAVADLVSHAVAGMTAEDVSVVDTSTGRALWGGGALPAVESAAGDQSRREAELAAKVERVLASVLGSPTNFSVAVMVELTSATVESTTQSVDPDSAAPTTESIETESSAGEGGQVPGVASNVPGTGTDVSSVAGRSRERQQTTYLYTRTQSTTTQPAGDLRRVSASVVVNSAALAALAGEGAAAEEPAAQKARLEGLVKAAIGADNTRGDLVTVEVLPFAEPLLVEDAPAVAAAAWQAWIPQAVALLAVILVLVFGIRPLVRAATTPTRPAFPAPGEGLPAVAAGVAGEDEAAGGAEVIDLATRLRRHVETFQHVSSQELSELVRLDGERSAEVLRRWMREQ